MKRAWVWILVTMFLASWFLPVVNEPHYTPTPRWLPGWDALLVALGLNENDASVRSIASAATNLLMVAAIAWLLRSPRHRVPRWAGWMLAAAALLNLAWALPPERPQDRIPLSVGYWLWTATFLLASALLLFEARQAEGPPAAPRFRGVGTPSAR